MAKQIKKILLSCMVIMSIIFIFVPKLPKDFNQGTVNLCGTGDKDPKPDDNPIGNSTNGD